MKKSTLLISNAIQEAYYYYVIRDTFRVYSCPLRLLRSFISGWKNSAFCF